MYYSAKESCWPILGSLNIVPHTVFIVAVTYGNENITKPINNNFMRHMVDELKRLMQNGINILKKIGI